MSDPEYDPRELPNFAALKTALDDHESQRLRTWISKLEGWAKVAVGEVDRLDRIIDDERSEFDDKMQTAKHRLLEAEGSAEELEELRERILDVDRGILTAGELAVEVARS